MKNQIQYKIINAGPSYFSDDVSENLEKMVNIYLENGWCLEGGISTLYTPKGYQMFQTVTKMTYDNSSLEESMLTEMKIPVLCPEFLN